MMKRETKSIPNNTFSPYLVIGGGIAGTTAAEAIRGIDSAAAITIISAEPYPLYSRLMLSKPYFFLGEIPFENVWLKKEEWYHERNITLRAGRRAGELHISHKTIVLDDGSRYTYGKLLIATGGVPKKVVIEGIEKNGIFRLQTIDDAKAIITRLPKVKRAVVIGAGFVGFEMCEILRKAGVEVTLLIRGERFWERILDPASSDLIEGSLAKEGISIIKGRTVQTFKGEKEVEGITLNDGTSINADMVLLGVGIEYPVRWIHEAGVVTERGVLVNEYFETNVSDIWAAGDIAQYRDPVLNGHFHSGSWVHAQMQGRAAGMNMAGKRTPFSMVPFYTCHACAMNVVFIGNTEEFEGRTAILRTEPAKNSAAQLFLHHGTLVGATLINRTPEMGALIKLIEEKTDLTPFTNMLSNPAHAIPSAHALQN